MEWIKDVEKLKYPNTKYFRFKSLYKCNNCGYTAVMWKSVRVSEQKTCVKCCKTKHGESKTRLYQIWNSMIGRCYRKSNVSFINYGAIGILVCEDWLIFDNFKKWANDTGYNSDLTIDRIENNKGYFPDNCRWTTHSTQQSNKNRMANNTSGYIGVNYIRSSKNWLAELNHNKERVNLGRFDSPEKAAHARNMYIEKHGLPHTKNKINNNNLKLEHMDLSFLKNIKIAEVAVKAKAVRVGLEKAPVNGADFRVYRNGRIFSHPNTAASFSLEFGPKAEVDGKAVTTGCGLDIFSSVDWQMIVLEQPLLFAAIVPREGNPKIDVYASTGYEEDGSPKGSITNNTISTFGKEVLVGLLADTYGVDWETTEFVDLVLKREYQIVAPKGVYSIPKVVSRGEKKGEQVFVTRNEILVFPLVVFEPSSTIDPNQVDLEDSIAEAEAEGAEDEGVEEEVAEEADETEV